MAYLADTDVSVFSMGDSCQYYGFRWTLEGTRAKVVSLRTMDAAIIPIAASRNLFPIPQELFHTPDVTPEQVTDVITETCANVSSKPEKRSKTTDETIAEVFTTSVSSAPLWHERLGHIGKQNLKVMSKHP